MIKHDKPKRMVSVDFETGALQAEEFLKGRRRHREDGPARVFYDAATKMPVQEEWFVEHMRHRADGPAFIVYAPQGKPLLEEWYCAGKLHRENGPAIIKRNPNGALEEEFWYLNGKLGRLDPGPTKLWYDAYNPSKQTLRSEEWVSGRRRHREGGPAVIARDVDGVVIHESWYFEGKLHRVGGPAFVTRSQAQRSTSFSYYSNGRLRFHKTVSGFQYEGVASSRPNHAIARDRKPGFSLGDS